MAKHFSRKPFVKGYLVVDINENGIIDEYLVARVVDTMKSTQVAILAHKHKDLSHFQGLNWGISETVYGCGFNRENEAFARLVKKNNPNLSSEDFVFIQQNGLFDFLKKAGVRVFEV